MEKLSILFRNSLVAKLRISRYSTRPFGINYRVFMKLLNLATQFLFLTKRARIDKNFHGIQISQNPHTVSLNIITFL